MPDTAPPLHHGYGSDMTGCFWSAKKRRKRRKEGKRGKEGGPEQTDHHAKSKVIKGKAYRYESSSDSEEYTDEEDSEGGEDGDVQRRRVGPDSICRRKGEVTDWYPMLSTFTSRTGTVVPHCDTIKWRSTPYLLFVNLE